MGQTILETLRQTWAGYIAALSVAIPRLLAALSVLLAGWLFAAAARWLTLRVLRGIRFPRFSERTGAAELLRKAQLPPGERLIASAVFWLLLAAFLLAGLDALGFETLASLREQVVAIAPRLVTSIVILAVGLVLANFFWRVALLAAVNAGWPNARLVGGFIHALLVVTAVAMALDHLRVARGVVIAAFAAAFGAVLLAAAIAIGIGAGPLVRRVLEERFAVRGRPESDGSSHL